MNSTMQVLVIGGTGTLGRQIAKNAIDAGHKVRCMVRKPKAASFLQEWGCELTRGNLLNKEVKAKDVAQAFVAIAKMQLTTGALLTVDGGNVSAMVR